MSADLPLTSVDEACDDALSERIALPEGKSFAQIRAEFEAMTLPATRPTPDEIAVAAAAAEATRFSLGEMLAVMTIVSVAMAGVRWLPPPVYAGIVGFAMFGWLIAMSLLNVESRLAKLIWWSLLTVYLLTLILSLVTVIQGG
jgi:hypothetical protein